MFEAANLASHPAPAVSFHRCFHHSASSIPSFRSRVHETLDSLLQICRSMKLLKQLHAQLITHALLPESLTLGRLIAFCAVSDSGDLHYGRRVFDRVPQPNAFMWNSIIRGYSRCRCPREALLLHRRMLRYGLSPNQFTLPFVLKSCASLPALEQASMLHALVFKLGFEEQIFVSNALLSAYASCGSIALAHKVFEEIPNRNVVSWNSLIAAFSHSCDCVKACNLFRAMRKSDIEPDGFTLVSALSACGAAVNLELGRAIHHHIVITGTNVDLITGNALLDMYGKCGELVAARKCFDRMNLKNVVSWTSMVSGFANQGLLDAARSWFDQMPEKNVISWNVMLFCYVQHGQCREALNLFTNMKSSSGVIPDEATLVAVLSACSQTGDLIYGKNIHNYIGEHIVNPSVALLNSLVDMYAKCGSIDTAFEIFRLIPQKTVVSWNIIIGGFAMNGSAFDAIEIFMQMIREGFPPDNITFTGLLCACGHGGLLEHGMYYFDAIRNIYGVPHEIEHYACMVDLLGRRGRLEKAMELIRSMPMKPDVVIWGALLGACRIHGNMLIGEQVMKQLLELDSDSGGLYVLVSNMYGESQKWEDMNNIRNLMRENQIKKCCATSSIEINGVICEFLVGDLRHESSSDIYSLLDKLTEHLISIGRSASPQEAILVEGQ